jgi:hypothetical protein
MGQGSGHHEHGRHGVEKEFSHPPRTGWSVMPRKGFFPGDYTMMKQWSARYFLKAFSIFSFAAIYLSAPIATSAKNVVAIYHKSVLK